MAQLGRFLLAGVIVASSFAFAGEAVVPAGPADLQLELVAHTELPRKSTFDGKKIGGLSGVQWTGSKLIAVSDDRGKFGEPRFFEFDLKLEATSVKLTPVRVHVVKAPEKTWVLDDEALVILPNGDFLISTEGDNNKKPRALPHLFEVTTEGKYVSEIPLPEKFLPERLGQQTKGIENNRGFEGVTTTPDGKHLYAMNEAPLINESTAEDCRTAWVRLIDFEKSDKGYKAIAEYPYQLDKLTQDENGPELYRGVSEILYLAPQKFLVLERGVRLTTKGIRYTAGIYSYDITGLKDVANTPRLCTATQASGKKTKLVDIATALKNEPVENFEALSWGPLLPDGRRTLLVLNDDNFSAKEKTQLLVFAVKEAAR
jgi:3-phytase